MSKKLLLSFVLLCVGVTARAGSFLISPVHLDLPPGQSTTVLQIKNNTEAATVMQLSEFVWSQKNGKDVLTPTRVLLATPPIFTLPAGGEQIIRVGLRAKRDATRETTYRLILTQVPPKQLPGFRGLQIALRFSIPVFVAPLAGHATPKLDWSLRPLGGDKAELSAVNVGTAHAQVSDLSIGASTSGPALVEIGAGSGYLLPGTRRTWTIKLKNSAKPGQSLVLRGKTQRGAFDEHLNQIQ